jgi:hypothetical protein
MKTHIKPENMPPVAGLAAGSTNTDDDANNKKLTTPNAKAIAENPLDDAVLTQLIGSIISVASAISKAKDDGVLGSLPHDKAQLLEDLALAANNLYLSTATSKDALDDCRHDDREGAPTEASTNSNSQLRGSGGKGKVSLRRNSMSDKNGLMVLQPNSVTNKPNEQKHRRPHRSAASVHSTGSIVPLKRGESSLFRESSVPDDIKRGRLGIALTFTEGHFLVLRPKIETVRLYDSAISMDFLARFPIAFAAFNMVFVIAFFSLIVMCPLALTFMPIAIMEFTGTTHVLQGGVLNVTSVTDKSEGYEDPDFVPYLGWGWQRASVYIYIYFCAALMCCSIYVFLMWNRSMVRFLMITSKIRIASVLALTIVYSVSAGTLVSNSGHLLTLMMRFMFLLNLCFSDARLVTMRLRFTKERYSEFFGGEGQRGWMTVVAFVFGLTFFACDVFRHYLVLFASKQHPLITINVVNPINGNIMGVTNHAICDATFFSGMIMAAGVMYNQVSTYQGSGTTIANCRFDYSHK